MHSMSIASPRNTELVQDADLTDCKMELPKSRYLQSGLRSQGATLSANKLRAPFSMKGAKRTTYSLDSER